VDEAQDFHQDWWFPVQLMLRDPDKGRLCLFSDPEQTGVYGHGCPFPAGLVSFELTENCRNTKRIASYCGRVLNCLVMSFPSSPNGVKPEIYKPVSDARKRAQLARQIVMELIDQQFSPSRIALLSPWRKTSPESALNFIPAIHSKPLLGDDDNIPAWLEGRIIWASTIKLFKGLEADCVVLTDAPRVGSHGFNLADLYVAASRAKHRLVIIPTCQEAADELTNWASETTLSRSKT